MQGDSTEREIEAVARALAKLANDTAEQASRMIIRYEWEEYIGEAEAAVAALDRARDARDDGEGKLAEFQEGLTRALNRHGVPAMPSWDAAIDWLAEHGSRSPQGEDREVPCLRCDGSGREGGNTMPASRVCSLCHGTGKQRVRSQGEDRELREKVANELRYNDECFSLKPAPWKQYLADADVILRVVAEHGSQGEDHEAIWRVGRKVGRTIYEQSGPEPSDSDKLIGVMDTPALAGLVVDAVNTVSSPSRDGTGEPNS